MSSVKPGEWRPHGAAGGPDAADGLSLFKIVTVLRRRKWTILSIVLLTSVGTYEVVSQLPRRYTAEAVIMIEPRKSQVLDVKSGVPQVAVDASTIRTEAEVLRSLDLAEKVATKLNLRHEKEFGPKPGTLAVLAEKSGLNAILTPGIRDFFASIGNYFSEGSPATDAPAAQPAAEAAANAGMVPAAPAPASMAPVVAAADPHKDVLPKMEDLAVRLRDNLGVSNDGRSAIIKVRYDTEDPELGASIVNTYAKTYIDDQLAAKSEAIVRASVLLAQRVEELRETVGESDRAVQTFRDENRLSEARGMTVTAQQLAETNTQLTMASSERAQKEANLNQLMAMISSGDGPQAALQIMSSPAILQLKEQQTEVSRREADLMAKFGANHPAVADVQNEKQRIDDKIAAEMGNIVLGLKNEVEAERARETALKQSLAELEERAHELDKAEVHLRQLEREANANHELYEHFLMRSKETSVQKYFEEADARILSEALVPKDATFPQTSRIVGLALFASLLGALALALLLDQFDHTFLNIDSLEREADVLSFGMIPEVGRGRGGPRMVIEHPTSSFSEAIRWIRTSLELATTNRPKVILVTSSVSREGKTTFSASLARSAAQSGQRVLLIDCDLRLGTIGKVFEATGHSGLESLLGGDASASDVIRLDLASKLQYIPAIPGAANPQALLGSAKMAMLLQKMREAYDLVILDAPPVLPVSDALVIAKLADATIFLVKWNATPRSNAVKALRELRKVGGNVAGVVLYRVNLRKNTANGYINPEPYYYGTSQDAPPPPVQARKAAVERS